MFEKKNLVLICLTLYLGLSFIICTGITQDELCSGQFTNFKVKFAFKIGKYIAMNGKFWRNSESESEAKSGTVRVLHLADKKILDPTLNKPVSFFGAKVWNEIQDLENQKKIKYAFTTNNMIPLFKDQQMSEIVFMVEESNITTAFQFNDQRIESGEESTFNASDQKKVFDSRDNFDESDYLNLKFLLIHFPDQLRIISIMIFDRTVIDVKYSIHYAIVYTEEMFEGKAYYFRHYMRSKRHEYIDFKGREYTFYRLDWFFDENIKYCDELKRAPTAVVMLSKRDTSMGFGKNDRFEAYFAEFYGLKHRLMKITFEYKIYEYVISVENSEIDNVKELLNCKSHPLMSEQEEVPCIEYPEGEKAEEDGVPKNVVILFESKDSISSSSSFLVWFAIVLIGIAVILVMGFGLYIVIKPNINREN